LRSAINWPDDIDELPALCDDGTLLLPDDSADDDSSSFAAATSAGKLSNLF
jgi:hypothetical protein